MPATSVLIDEHLQYQEGLGTAVTKARNKFRLNLQRALDYLWNLREFPFTQFATTASLINVTIAGKTRTYLNVPTTDDFLRLGPHAVVVIDDSELMWVPRWRLERFYQTAQSVSARPTWYTDPETTGANTVAIYVFPPLSSVSGHTASLSYKYRSPTLIDGTLNPTDASSDPLLQGIFPEQWHRPVLYELAVLYEMKDKGNIQAASIQQRIVNENIRNFLAVERPASAAGQTLVPFTAGGRRMWR